VVPRRCQLDRTGPRPAATFGGAARRLPSRLWGRFRYWVLGLGSGDLRIHTYGAQHEEIFVPSVLFVGYKIHAVQRLIAEKPAEFGHPTIK
jgi:hypothetical protein